MTDTRIPALIAARQIMTWARGKPEPIRQIAAVLVAQLRISARCPNFTAMHKAVAASAKRLEAAR
jgi:hypothetical protein